MAAKRDLMRILTDPTQFHLIEKHLYSYIEGIHIGQGQGDSYREIPTTTKLINFSNPMSLQLIVRNEASNRIAFFQSDSTWTGNQFIQLKLFGDSMGVIDSAPGRIVTFQVRRHEARGGKLARTASVSCLTFFNGGPGWKRVLCNVGTPFGADNPIVPYEILTGPAALTFKLRGHGGETVHVTVGNRMDDESLLVNERVFRMLIPNIENEQSMMNNSSFIWYLGMNYFGDTDVIHSYDLTLYIRFLRRILGEGAPEDVVMPELQTALLRHRGKQLAGRIATNLGAKYGREQAWREFEESMAGLAQHLEKGVGQPGSAQALERQVGLRSTKRKFDDIVDWSRLPADEQSKRPRPEFFSRWYNF